MNLRQSKSSQLLQRIAFLFNDSISNFYQCSIYIHIWRKNAEAIKYLGILKTFVSKNKIYFCLKKKRNVSLHKKVIFVFHTIFKLDFKTQIIYCIIYRYLYTLFILFCSLISVSKKRNIEIMLTLPYSYNWQKFNNKMNEKRSQEYQYGPWICNWTN